MPGLSRLINRWMLSNAWLSIGSIKEIVDKNSLKLSRLKKKEHLLKTVKAHFHL